MQIMNELTQHVCRAVTNIDGKTGNSNNRERITSIDALRAITLLGILFVHTSQMFGWSNAGEHTGKIGNIFLSLINLLLTNRCNRIFGILFGVSFYLILRNPTYSTWKFVWRCFLLLIIGILNKVFYTYDALMWYGLWGMVLACFRRLPVKKLWTAFFIVYLVNFIVRYSVDLRDLLFGVEIKVNRYTNSRTLSDVISYPLWMSIKDYVYAVIEAPLGTLSHFLLGYCIANSGIIENLKKYVNGLNLIIFTILYIIFSFIGIRYHIAIFKNIGYLCGSFCYALLFLLIYYKTFPFFKFLEPYGKLGLTNYSMQGIVGVILTSLIFIPKQLSFELVLLIMACFFAVQVLFSILWLKKYKYGPFEWIWRSATERRVIDNRR